MAEPIDEGMLIAWLDGELPPAEAARVATAVEADPALAALAERHRRLRARLTAVFGPIADEPVAMPVPPPSATVHSLDAARAKARRAAAPAAVRRPVRWTMPGAIAASLIVGVLAGHGLSGGRGVADEANALALSPPIAAALDSQLSGDAGPVRVALSFRDQSGDLCRSFSAQHLTGVACRAGRGWQLRYGAPGTAQDGAYRMAGGDGDTMKMVETMIAGEPLDRAGEEAARAKGWAR